MNHIAVSSNINPQSPVRLQRRPSEVMSNLTVPACKPPRTAGMLVGRPELSEEAVVAAIAERMAFEGRDASKAAAVLKAAFADRPAAKAFLRRLVLPVPQAPLPMPTQAILRVRPEAARAAPWLRFVTFGR